MNNKKLGTLLEVTNYILSFRVDIVWKCIIIDSHKHRLYSGYLHNWLYEGLTNLNVTALILNTETQTAYISTEEV